MALRMDLRLEWTAAKADPASDVGVQDEECPACGCPAAMRSPGEVGRSSIPGDGLRADGDSRCSAFSPTQTRHADPMNERGPRGPPALCCQGRMLVLFRSRFAGVVVACA
jgi:hypothetical protein